MITKKWLTNITETTLASAQDLFSRGKTALQIDHKQEISELQNQLQELAPNTQTWIQTLIKNAKLEGKIKLPERDLLLAEITAYSYLPPEKRPYQVWDFYLEPSYNSIFHCIYLNHKEKICIIGYRGTDFTNKSDIISDVQIILWVNAIDPRVTGSLQLFDQVRKTHGEYQKWICGHSLGGTLCYIVAKHRDVDYCCTFNPWSAPNKIFILMLKDTLLKTERTKKIHTYKIVGDVVSLFSYVGETVSFFVPSVNLKTLHAMDNFFEIKYQRK